ncbi:MAG: MATE family efflux transporter [Bacillota bacterium]|jgi:putative MATE family efflux protein
MDRSAHDDFVSDNSVSLEDAGIEKGMVKEEALRDSRTGEVFHSANDEALAKQPAKGLVEDRAAIRKKIINLALPALVEQTLMTMVSMADMIMVGRLGPWAIAAVGLSSQPMFVAMSVFIALNVGATALVARFVGAGEPDEASKVARQALMIAVIMGLALAVIGVSFSGQILHFMGAEEDVIGPGTGYLKVVCLGLPVWAVTISLTAALRGAGDTRTPMTVNIVANLVNVIGNYLLIHGHLGLPRLEVTGAGLATTISRVVASVLILTKVLKGGKVIKISIHDSFRFDSQIIKRILNVGIPAAIEQVVMRSGQMTFARIVSSLGTNTYAAHQIALNIEGFTFTPGMSFQIASTTLVGQSLGARNPDRAEQVGWEAVRIGASIGVIVGILYFAFGSQLAHLYTDDPAVTALAAGALKIIALSQPFMISMFILIGGLRGAGDTRWTLLITMLGFWGIRVVTAYFLAIRLNLGLYGAWIGMALDMVVRSVLGVLRFRAGGWKHTRV